MKQKTGNNSTSFQAQNIIINQGASEQEVREIALNVFKDNFIELSDIAKNTAKIRAEEITNDFVKKLQNENPEALNKAQDPDFQDALFNVQKEYAKSGDKELGDLLVNLLADRTQHDQRTIAQIVLSESIKTAPKLTDDQLAALAIIFLFRYSKNYNILTHEILGRFWDHHVKFFIEKLSKNNSCYQHLQFAGCGSMIPAITPNLSLEKILELHYQGLFLKGFDPAEIENRGISLSEEDIKMFFIPCLNDIKKLQINSLDKESLDKKIKNRNISDENKVIIEALFELNKMSEAEIKEKCIAIRPYLSKLFDIYSETGMQNFNLTSVGIAIGHANIKRLAGKFADLSIWIS